MSLFDCDAACEIFSGSVKRQCGFVFALSHKMGSEDAAFRDYDNFGRSSVCSFRQ